WETLRGLWLKAEKGGGSEYPQVVGATWGNAMNIMTFEGYQAKIEYDTKLAKWTVMPYYEV
ncbi:MAG: hypothetical protein KBD35_09695, partial [Moraxellaceae bacterium]|nr:hypothetical protein [Moraxellaceae bacterium]